MKWHSKRGVKAIGALCLVFSLSAALILPSATYAAAPDGAMSSDTSVRLVTKVGFNEGSIQRTLPRGFTGQQFAYVTGRLGALPEGKSRYAIVIGSNYVNSVSPGAQIPLIPPFTLELGYAEVDAEAMAGLLMAVYGFDSVIPLIGDTASRGNILNAIEQVKSLAKRGDEIVFYYSGHGAQYLKAIGGRGYSNGWGIINEGIVTDEGDGQEVGFIWDKELDKSFKQFNTNRIVFIFDSCVAGGMTELSEIGRIVCMATTSNGIAAEAGESGGMAINHGLFTFFLLGALSGVFPEADTCDHDQNPETPDVTIEEAYNLASFSIIDLTPLIQEQLAAYFGPDVAALWGTPTIKDLFLWQDLLL